MAIWRLYAAWLTSTRRSCGVGSGRRRPPSSPWRRCSRSAASATRPWSSWTTKKWNTPFYEAPSPRTGSTNFCETCRLAVARQPPSKAPNCQILIQLNHGTDKMASCRPKKISTSPMSNSTTSKMNSKSPPQSQRHFQFIIQLKTTNKFIFVYFIKWLLIIQ